MKIEIEKNIDNPDLLERMYRENTTVFRSEFDEAYPQIQNTISARFWHARLNYERSGISHSSKWDLMYVVVASLVAALLAKIPTLGAIDEERFYTCNIGFIAFPLLAFYFIWKRKLTPFRTLCIAGAVFISVVYINSFPIDPTSDTLMLASIHLPMFMLAIVGFTYVGENFRDMTKRVEFLRYMADLLVMTTLLLISGALVTALTFGLFSMTALNMEEFYFNYVIVSGLAASPIVATYLIQNNPQAVHRISPIIARVFTPIVLVTLVIYLGTMLYSGKDIYNDRVLLLIFNFMLIGVMALILFSVTEMTKGGNHRFLTFQLFLLALVTIIVNAIALSAILFRITEWGITPNRLAVMGSNILILLNLVMVTRSLWAAIRNRRNREGVENTIAVYLPVYSLWSAFVVFILPVVFEFN